MSPPSESSWSASAEFLLLGAIWGSAFMFMRVAAPAFGAMPLVELRLGLGALVLLPFLWRDRRHFTPGMWLRVTLVGMVNAAVPSALFAWAAERAPAGIGAIANSTTALFAAVVAVRFFGERMPARSVAGLAAGFIGVVVLASGKAQGGSLTAAAIAGTLGALCYGVGINLVRRYLWALPPFAGACANLLTASVLCAPLAIATWPSTPAPGEAWWSAIALGAVCSGVAYVLYYRIIHRLGAPRAATVSYLIPLFGVFWGWLLLDEAITATMAAACALILVGVALSQQRA
ncbi:MAG: DMT family transporter [Pseudomonadota bacterium]|jgi:drug/metabolite transporter (DMT)-like permease|nr:MAG: EamA family transporter [Pseudomonadota bacterium]